MERPTLTRHSRFRRWLWRLSLVLAGLALFYAGFLILGFVPVNWQYRPPPTDDCVVIWIRSNDIHTEVVMPAVQTDMEIDWRQLFPPEHFAGDVHNAPLVAVGWGSRAFYIETPTWAEFKLSTACGAVLTPSRAVLHVEYLGSAAAGANMREVRVSKAEYRRLAEFICQTVATSQDAFQATPATTTTYGRYDRFYEARGRYHAFNTCNQWTGRALAQAGVTTGIWTPLKWHVLYWLPE